MSISYNRVKDRTFSSKDGAEFKLRKLNVGACSKRIFCFDPYLSFALIAPVLANKIDAIESNPKEPDTQSGKCVLTQFVLSSDIGHRSRS